MVVRLAVLGENNDGYIVQRCSLVHLPTQGYLFSSQNVPSTVLSLSKCQMSNRIG